MEQAFLGDHPLSWLQVGIMSKEYTVDTHSTSALLPRSSHKVVKCEKRSKFESLQFVLKIDSTSLLILKAKQVASEGTRRL